jgi:Ca2+/Na+ antiporter
MALTTELIGLLLLALGAGVIFAVKRARFRRTNKYGVERFSTFEAKLRAQLGSHILVGISMILLGAGTIVLASTHMDSWGWVIMVPVVLFMLYMLLGLA